MSLKWKVSILVGVFLITAFAFAESGGQLPAANVSVTAGQPAAAAALPETPGIKPVPAQPTTIVPPGLGFTYGVDERYRGDTFNNADANSAANDEARFIRLRTRPWFNITVGDNVDAYFRAGNEAWKRFDATPPGQPGGATKSLSLPWIAGEWWIDNAYLNFKKLPGIPNASLKIGRFDMIRNEGFGMFCGNEGVGPRDAFWTGFLFGYTRGKQKFELIGNYMPTNDPMPVINGSNPSLNYYSSALPHIRETLMEQDVDSISFYYTNRMFKNTDIEAYYTFFHEYGMSCRPNSAGLCTYYTDTGLPYNSTNYLFYQPDRHYNMIAGRVVERFPQHVVAKVEFQGEFGTQNPFQYNGIQTVTSGKTATFTPLIESVDMRAWGLYSYATKYFQVKTKPYIRGVAVMLSGGKPGDTKTDGIYDNPYNRWAWHPSLPDPEGYQSPLFSDLYVYSQQKTEYQQNPAYMTNLRIFGVESGFTPFKKAWLIAAYQNVGAMNPYAPNPIWSNYAVNSGLPFYNTSYSATACAAAGQPLAQCSVVTGQNRYQLIKAEFKYILSPKFSFYISPEKDYFGDYYNTLHRNNGYYFRSEFNYTYSNFIPFKKAKVAKTDTTDSGS